MHEETYLWAAIYSSRVGRSAIEKEEKIPEIVTVLSGWNESSLESKKVYIQSVRQTEILQFERLAAYFCWKSTNLFTNKADHWLGTDMSSNCHMRCSYIIDHFKLDHNRL